MNDLYELVKGVVKNVMYDFLKSNKITQTKVMIAVNDCISGSTTSLYDLADTTTETQTYKNNTPFDITAGDYVILQYPFGSVDQGWIQYIK